ARPRRDGRQARQSREGRDDGSAHRPAQPPHVRRRSLAGAREGPRVPRDARPRRAEADQRAARPRGRRRAHPRRLGGTARRELDIATLEMRGGRRQDALAAALAAAVDAKDGGGYDHSGTVAELAASIAELLGLEREKVDEVRLAGLLHDVGYLDVDDAIFAK